MDAAIKAVAEEQTALSQSVEALNTALEGCGNCKITYGSYIGTGTTGASNPTKLTFDFCPVAIIVCDTNGEVGSGSTFYPGVMVRPAACSVGDSGKTVYLTWKNNAVQWYDNDGSASFNNSGTTYVYAALGYSV